ncbi:MAG: ABC transporter permease subunit [Chitinophagaceae bacterium]|nr:ABC transporter permease subunit [Chitinophagaceae bacterium]
MNKVIKFIVLDILKNKFVVIYTFILLILSWSVFSLENNFTKGLLSLLNIILLIVPMVAILFSTIYMYNSSEFIELLLGQPIKRKKIWMSMYIGLLISMTSAFLIGAGIPIILFAFSSVGLMMLVTGCLITIIFVSLAMLASILMRDKAKGIGLSMMIWLFFSLMFDGLVLFLLFQFSDYPIEKAMIGLSFLNPIGLSRILILLQLDVSALMGYTGAIFKDFFGTSMGVIISFLCLLCWAIIPFLISLSRFNRKDL